MDKTNKRLAILSLTILCFVLLSCSWFKSVENQKTENKTENKKELINLPNNMESGDEDNRITRDTSMIIGIAADKNIYQGIEQISKEQLTEKLKKIAEGKSEDDKIVYLKSDVNVDSKAVVDVLKTIRDAKINKVALVVNKSSNPRPNVLEIVLPPDTSKDTNVILRPNPLTLMVFGAGYDDKLLLNMEDAGSISDTAPLKTKLMDIFKRREKDGVFAEGTNEVEKTVFVRTSKINKYGDVVKIIDAIKSAGAKPIQWDIEEDAIPKIEEVPPPIKITPKR